MWNILMSVKRSKLNCINCRNCAAEGVRAVGAVVTDLTINGVRKLNKKCDL